MLSFVTGILLPNVFKVDPCAFYCRITVHCMEISAIFYPSVDGHLGWFHVLVLINNVVMDISVFV